MAGEARGKEETVLDSMEQVPATRRERVSAWLLAGRAARKVGVTTVGGLLGLVGLAMFVLPGPGMLVVILALGILSTEYHWPKRLSRWMRAEADRLAARARERRANRRRRR